MRGRGFGVVIVALAVLIAAWFQREDAVKKQREIEGPPETTIVVATTVVPITDPIVVTTVAVPAP